MNDKIKENEKMETKNLESIPGENDLPNVKSKEYYEKLVTERRMNSYEIRKNAQEVTQEVSAEDLDGIAGGKGRLRPTGDEKEYWKLNIDPKTTTIMYGGPRVKTLKELLEEKKKQEQEREKKIEQILKLAREIDEGRSNR